VARSSGQLLVTLNLVQSEARPPGGRIIAGQLLADDQRKLALINLKEVKNA
jgi:hypothetical protein